MAKPALTNVQLEQILRYDALLKFCGVLPYDKIPRLVQKYPCGFIFNTDMSEKTGSHWISVYFDKEKECQYFCPLGTEPYGLLFDFIERNAQTTLYNKRIIQHPLSSLCGYYCIYHLVHAARGYALFDIVNQFSEFNLKANDKSVFEFVDSWVTQIVDS